MTALCSLLIHVAASPKNTEVLELEPDTKNLTDDCNNQTILIR